ncbi:MAG: class I SAM-dependent methyltransferase, partial [Chlamydiota bacterium]
MIIILKMQRSQFPLFQSAVDLAQRYWKDLIRPGDWAIDATCGNGRDSLILAELLLKNSSDSGLIVIDIQPQAIALTQELLAKSLDAYQLKQAHFCCQSHAVFPSLAFEKPIRLIVYNLGYLPKGDKNLTTLTSSTLQSLEQAKNCIAPGGMISITCYPGHAEGALEEQALLKELSLFCPKEWNICFHRFLNRNASPSVLLIQK